MSNFSSKDAADALLLAISLRASGFGAHIISVGNVTIQGIVDMQAPLHRGLKQDARRPTGADELLAEMGGEAYDELRDIMEGKPTAAPTGPGSAAIIEEDD